MRDEPLHETRSRLKDIVLRRQRGLPETDDVLDVLERCLLILKAVDESLDGAPSVAGRARKTPSLEEMIGALEDAAYDAQSAAADLRSSLGRVRESLRGKDVAA